MLVYPPRAQLLQESQTTHEVAIPKEVYTGTGDQLFGFLANTLKDFITKHDRWGLEDS